MNVTHVAGVPIKPRHQATCHCGEVKLEVSLPNGLQDLRRCDCSQCRRRGAIVASVGLGDIRIVKGEEVLAEYQFNTMTARNFFCRNCGIYTHHQRRSDPTQYGINVACLEGINPLKLCEIPSFDGVNHPSDTHSA